MNKFLLTLALLTSTSFAFAQYGWTKAEVTLKNGTVLEGEASLAMMSNGINLGKEKLKFRKNKKDKKSKYLPKEVEQIVFTVSYKEKVGRKKVEKTRIENYIPVYLNKKQSKLGFVELMVDGNLRLVGRTVAVQSGGGWNGATGAPGAAPVYMPGYMGSHNQVMFLKEGEKPQIFNQVSLTKSFRKRAMDYFKDCPTLKNKIDKKEFIKEDLQDIVKFYNSSCN
ncbi:hypothetical protein [uncultured Lacinutrix sp.]|uniref:hypothetical protein n=1 Tax=uncultured Lacinutrix sp. TaxID=574032 RepID=UPI00261BA19D|nr:hypothetical protein [uncultured Lacinutrix sp.]